MSRYVLLSAVVLAACDGPPPIQHEPFCGDAILDPGEECDSLTALFDCRADCTIPFCGDGILDEGEVCDDGNFAANDGCEPSCVVSTCGNNIADEGELCLEEGTPLAANVPFGLVSADFNTDGHLDLAATELGTVSVLVFLGDGAGNFTKQSTVSLGLLVPLGIVAKDLDNDGDIDLATANNTNNADGTVAFSSYSTLLNDGNGNFVVGVSSPIQGKTHLAITANDFNNDGLADLAMVEFESGTLTIAFNLGGGLSFFEFSTPVNPLFFFGTQPFSITSGDIDQDGDSDILIADILSPSPRILKNNGAEPPSQDQLGSYGLGTTHLAFGDIEGDGDPDLVLSNQFFRAVGLWKDPLVTPLPTLGVAEKAWVSALGDLDGDGLAEVISADGGDLFNNSPGNSISLYSLGSEGSLSSRGTRVVGVGPAALAVGDFLEDGRTDIAVSLLQGSKIIILHGSN